MIIVAVFACITSIYCSEKPDIWETKSIGENAIIWNYRYGQREVGKSHGQFTFGSPGWRAPYGVSCAAMASAAVAVIGSQLADVPEAELRNPATIARIMREILETGALTYDETEKAVFSRFAEAESATEVLAERYSVRYNPQLSVAFFNKIQMFFFTSPPMEGLLGLLSERVTESTDLSAIGVIISDGTFSRAIIYMRNGYFVLYDSHARFTPDKAVRRGEAGSFIAFSKTIADIMTVAQLDGRWPTGPEISRSLLSPVFVEVRASELPRARLVSRAPSPGRRPAAAAAAAPKLETIDEQITHLEDILEEIEARLQNNPKDPYLLDRRVELISRLKIFRAKK